MAFFGFGASADIDINLHGEEDQPTSGMFVQSKDVEGNATKLMLYTNGQTVKGDVVVTLKGKKLEHLGVKIELVGIIELGNDQANTHEFITLTRQLEPSGELNDSKTYPFEFANVEKAYETYKGNNIHLRYFLRASIMRQYASNITKTVDFAVQNLQQEPESNNLIKMEVGIEDCLHIEFEYAKSKYNLADVVIGKIYFLLVRIKIKHMEIVIIKRESVGTGSNAINDSENIAKYEIMDGAPVRGEIIPIRLFLSPYDLTPTYKNIHNKFSIKYYLNLVLVDEEDRRYFKQQEITLWRADYKPMKVQSGKRTNQSQQ